VRTIASRSLAAESVSVVPVVAAVIAALSQ
jgi:hypothetical protein